MKFTTGEIISAATGRLCCDIGRVYVILNFLTGDNLFTHQLPRARRACEAWVKKQCPWLDELNTEACNTENWKEWLAEAESKYGKEHDVEPLPIGEWERRNPLEELVNMVGKEKVIVIETPSPVASGVE